MTGPTRDALWYPVGGHREQQSRCDEVRESQSRVVVAPSVGIGDFRFEKCGGLV